MRPGHAKHCINVSQLLSLCSGVDYSAQTVASSCSHLFFPTPLPLLPAGCLPLGASFRLPFPELLTVTGPKKLSNRPAGIGDLGYEHAFDKTSQQQE